ncbi:MAG: hypothetical protein Q9214_001017 [Letrouitia sp. 1 TL-2023]
MQRRVFRRINNLLGKLRNVHTLHLEQVGSVSSTILFEITFLREKDGSSLRNVTLLWDYGLDTAKAFMRLESLESLSVQSLISAQQLVQLKHEQGNPQLSFSLNFLPRLPLPEDMTKTLLTRLGNVVKVQALLTGDDENRGLLPGTMEMNGPLSPAAVSRTFGPIKSTLRELQLTSGGMFWPSHDQTRLDVSDFVALRVLQVPCNCLFPPESESRNGVYKLLPKSLQTLKNFTSAKMDKDEFDWLVELALNKETQLPEIEHVILSEDNGNEGNGTEMGFQMGSKGLPSSLTSLCVMHEIKVDVEFL